MSLLADLRQLRQPAEFRIAAPSWPPVLDALAALVDGAAAATAPARTAAPRAEPAAEQFRFLAEAATGLWRLRQRMLEPGTDRPQESMRRAFRHLQSAWDVLEQAGLEVLDHTGMAFDAGLSLKVLAFQPVAGAARETVIETIKPTIYFRGTSLQMGEVIVGTPGAAAPGTQEA